MDLHGKDDQSEVCECQWCGQETYFIGTRACNRCWELSHRIEMDIKLAEKMLQTFKQAEGKL